jgi:type IV secretory pathway VirB10-like protein
MSGSLTAIITIPIVVAIVLFSWIAAVLHAEKHPHWKRPLPPPRTEVAGGAFRALAGGRQVMPIPEEPPAGVPGQRAAAGDEYYETAVRKHATGAPAAESAEAAAESAEAAAESAEAAAESAEAAAGPAGAPGERAGVGRPPS